VGFKVFKYIVAYLGGFSPALLLIGQLKELWPAVEIQIGPEHTLVEKSRRKWMAVVITLGVLPLLVNLFYDILKAATGN
jgi:hypothetical protein